MHRHNDSAFDRIRTSFFVGLAMCSMIMCLLFTSSLYAQERISPSDVQATAVDSAQITLTWDNVPDDSFLIERSGTWGGPLSEAGTAGENVTIFTGVGLAANTTYYYPVRASDVSGNSNYSNAANATTNPNAPVAPSGLTATANAFPARIIHL
jgi:hypothetical protein